MLPPLAPVLAASWTLAHPSLDAVRPPQSDRSHDDVHLPPSCPVPTPAIHGPAEPWDWPRDVLLIGSSSMEHGFGPALGRELEARGIARVTRRARYATSLTRRDYFDWIDAVDTLAPSRPDLVIALFGGNDGQTLRSPSGERWGPWSSSLWHAGYHHRIERMVRRFRSEGAQVVILGYPHPTRPVYDRHIAEINATLYQAAADAGAGWVSLWDLTSDPQDQPLTSWPAPTGPRPLHQADGIHLSFGGDAWVAEQVAEVLSGWFDPTPTCVPDAPPEPALLPVPLLDFPTPRPTTEDTDADTDTER